MSSAPTIGWLNAGKIGAGTWVCGIDGTQIAVFYSSSINPRAADDLRLALAASDLLIAAQRMMFRPEVNVATVNGNPGMAQAADGLAEAIRKATGESPYKPRSTITSEYRDEK